MLKKYETKMAITWNGKLPVKKLLVAVGSNWQAQVNF
jgi:hypothetical protein